MASSYIDYQSVKGRHIDTRYMSYNPNLDCMECCKTGYRISRREFEELKYMEQRYYRDYYNTQMDSLQAVQALGQTPTPNAIPVKPKINKKLLLVRNNKLKG